MPLITFPAKDLAPKEGLAVLTEVPATLTADGAKAFGSMYRAGTAMDPVSLAVAVDGKAQLPALPDLGSEPTAAAEPTKKAAEKASAAPAAASSDSGPRTGVYLAAGGGALLLVAAGAAFFALRRRAARPHPRRRVRGPRLLPDLLTPGTPHACLMDPHPLPRASLPPPVR